MEESPVVMRDASTPRTKASKLRTVPNDHKEEQAVATKTPLSKKSKSTSIGFGSLWWSRRRKGKKENVISIPLQDLAAEPKPKPAPPPDDPFIGIYIASAGTFPLPP